MDLVFQNPWRILGLQATASTRELTRRVEDLKTFAEFGKKKHYPLDLQALSAFSRSEENIAEAAKKLERDDNKLVYSFFWFLADDDIDRAALDAINEGQFGQAIDIINQQIDNAGEVRFSWLLNRAVLLFINCAAVQFNQVIFTQAMRDAALVINRHFDQLQAKVLPGGQRAIDKNSVVRRIVDEIVGFINRRNLAPYAQDGRALLSLFSAFPQDARDYLAEKRILPVADRLQSAIDHSAQLRAEQSDTEIDTGNGLAAVADLAQELSVYTDNYHAQRALNAYADELTECSIYACNQLDDLVLAQKLLDQASAVASSGEVANRIAESHISLQNIVTERKDSEQFDELVAQMEQPLSSLRQSRELINAFSAAIQKMTEGTELYQLTSSNCVMKVMGYLIDVFNQGQETFDRANRNNLEQALSVFKTTVEEINKQIILLRGFNTDPKTRVWFSKNRTTIANTLSDLDELANKIANAKVERLAQRVTGTPGASTVKKGKYTIIGWVIFILVILIALAK